MSKLEDKLAASIKPARKQNTAVKAPARKTAAAAKPAPATATRAPATGAPVRPAQETPDLNSGNQSLHPRRIWPD